LTKNSGGIDTRGKRVFTGERDVWVHRMGCTGSHDTGRRFTEGEKA